MVSFQKKLATGLRACGLSVVYDPQDLPYDALLVIGGTHRLDGLWRAKRAGIPIVQRLDGMNWLHRKRKAGGLRHFLRAEYGNRILALIRSRLAGQIVYQSEFSRRWWEQVYGPAPIPSRVIYNGVDLSAYQPSASGETPSDRWRLLLVEGSLRGGYEGGLETAIRLGEALARQLDRRPDLSRLGQVELVVAGRVDSALQAEWDRRSAGLHGLSLVWAGLVPPAQIPGFDRSAHFLYSADLNPACPNSVIEALACGLPVLAFDTGALPEMVDAASGRVVPYGGDPWQLDPPDIRALAQAGLEILSEQTDLRTGARARAETQFDLDVMTRAYLEVLLGG
jgi:glycosyltransferase involved in cell wall biosynthesis